MNVLKNGSASSPPPLPPPSPRGGANYEMLPFFKNPTLTAKNEPMPTLLNASFGQKFNKHLGRLFEASQTSHLLKVQGLTFGGNDHSVTASLPRT